jgi:hypothetical protein
MDVRIIGCDCTAVPPYKHRDAKENQLEYVLVRNVDELRKIL